MYVFDLKLKYLMTLSNNNSKFYNTHNNTQDGKLIDKRVFL